METLNANPIAARVTVFLIRIINTPFSSYVHFRADDLLLKPDNPGRGQTCVGQVQGKTR